MTAARRCLSAPAPRRVKTRVNGAGGALRAADAMAIWQVSIDTAASGAADTRSGKADETAAAGRPEERTLLRTRA